MIEIKDLNRYEKDRWGLYGGLSGSKYGILIDGARWMVKFPEIQNIFLVKINLIIIFRLIRQVRSVNI